MAEKSDHAEGDSPQRRLTRLDAELVRLLESRADAVRALREANGTVDAESDQSARQALLDGYRGPLDHERLRAALREIQSSSRADADEPRIAFLGPLYSYSHIATLERFGAAASLAPVGNIAAVFDEVRSGRAQFGVAPIENSTDGRIVDTLSMFARHPMRITGEIQLRIHHCLLGRCKQEDVRAVYSKPQALSQCREWLAANLPQAETGEVASTALAAEKAASESGVAAIASRQAGVQNDLDVIVANIEDNPNNVTRFAVLGGAPPAASGCDKTTLMFQLPHKPGALADAMAVFKRDELNLTWIESFPTPGAPNEYLFFVEFEGHAEDGPCRNSIESLCQMCLKLDVLGSYRRTSPVG